MGTYYTSPSNQGDGAPMASYLREPLPVMYGEGTVLSGNPMIYMNPGSFPQDSSIGGSQPQPQPQPPQVVAEHDFGGWRGDGTNEMLIVNPMGQGLSLSLGTQIPASMSYRNPNTGFTSFLNPTPSFGNASSRDENARVAECLPPGFPGGVQEQSRGDSDLYGVSSVTRTFQDSKYLKAAQELLDQVVNVRKALVKKSSSKEGDVGLKNVASVSNTQESGKNFPAELSPAEKQEMQGKLAKLLSMLDEVDRRYKQYYHQMQIVISSFDVIAGCGASKPYTALALQTISRHFRSLRDSINGQILATRKSLGELDASENGKGVGISRLRYVDRHLRQQKALQQLGMMQQHAWRPQRGLPESSVSILRAWLFEHFLHPYPKDSDKIMLARQTGLTRSQVSNWFINARVRLWKPMVEEMYKEEYADAELHSISSSDNAAKATKGSSTKRSCPDEGEDLQQGGSSTGTERCSTGQLMDSKSDNATNVEMAGSTAGTSFHNTRAETEGEYGGDDRFMAAAAAYQMSEFGRLGNASGSGVSLTLGLQQQHYEGTSVPMSGATHQSFVGMRGDDIYNAQASSLGADFESINADNQQHRFGSSHLFHDFVA